jgi:hypothetical protein
VKQPIKFDSFENWAGGASPLLYPPHRGEERIKAFPLDGERLDRGESLSHMVLFSFSAGERKIMNHFVVNLNAAKQIGATIPPEVLARADR